MNSILVQDRVRSCITPKLTQLCETDEALSCTLKFGLCLSHGGWVYLSIAIEKFCTDNQYSYSKVCRSAILLEPCGLFSPRFCDRHCVRISKYLLIYGAKAHETTGAKEMFRHWWWIVLSQEHQISELGALVHVIYCTITHSREISIEFVMAQFKA